MKKAYVLLTIEIGSEREVLDSLKEIPNVKEVHKIYGVYDFIIRVEAETPQGLKDTINSSIRGLDNIRSVITLMCMDEKES